VTVIGFDHGYVRVLGDRMETTMFIVNIDSGWVNSTRRGNGASGHDEWAIGSLRPIPITKSECVWNIR